MGTISFAEEGLLFGWKCLKEYGMPTFFVGFYLLGLLYVCCHGNRKERYFFCQIFLFLLVTIYNPLIANPVIKVMRMWLEYYRFFWILPITVLAAWCCVKIVGRQKKRAARIVLTGGLLAIMLFSGNPVIKAESFRQMPDNAYKVPDGLLTACELIRQDAKTDFPKAVFEYEYNCLARQYDGKLRLTLDRDVYLLELGSNSVNTRDIPQEEVERQQQIIRTVQQGQPVVDAEAFAALLKATQTDYLVVNKEKQELLAYLAEAGCVSFADTGTHLLFRYDWGENGS